VKSFFDALQLTLSDAVLQDDQCKEHILRLIESLGRIEDLIFELRTFQVHNARPGHPLDAVCLKAMEAATRSLALQ
jgi:hypothetical protein